MPVKVYNVIIVGCIIILVGVLLRSYFYPTNNEMTATIPQITPTTIIPSPQNNKYQSIPCNNIYYPQLDASHSYKGFVIASNSGTIAKTITFTVSTISKNKSSSIVTIEDEKDLKTSINLTCTDNGIMGVSIPVVVFMEYIMKQTNLATLLPKKIDSMLTMVVLPQNENLKNGYSWNDYPLSNADFALFMQFIQKITIKNHVSISSNNLTLQRTMEMPEMLSKTTANKKELIKIIEEYKQGVGLQKGTLVITEEGKENTVFSFQRTEN